MGVFSPFLGLSFSTLHSTFFSSRVAPGLPLFSHTTLLIAKSTGHLWIFCLPLLKCEVESGTALPESRSWVILSKTSYLLQGFCLRVLGILQNVG